MKLEQSFEVAAPLARVWEALIDVQRVAPCLPGAAVTDRNDDGSYNGTFKVKIGPTSAAYSGKLHMEDVDESAHTATMQAAGTDKRGQGGAKATIVSSVVDSGSGSTRVTVITDYHITGRLARFGRGGMIEDISNRLLGDFAKCLQSSLAGEPEPGPEVESSTAASGSSPAVGSPADAGEGQAEVVAPSSPNGSPAGAAASSPLTPSTPPPSYAPPVNRPTESEPVQGLTLVGSVLWGQAKRNPAPLAALLFGFLLALRVLRRRG
jgi:carbon monoxide dehydrogenase subunit G